MRLLITLFLFFNLVTALHGQQDSSFSIELLENYFDDEQLDTDDSQLYDLFEYLIHNPIDINSASLDELLTIRTIDRRIAEHLINHRNEYGIFNSIYDINNIARFSEEDKNKLLPFITVSQQKIFSRIDKFLAEILANTSINFRSRTMSDIQERNGFAENKFGGSRIKTYNRLHLKSGQRFKAGLLIEKDAGEKSLNDFHSFFIQANEIGFVENFIAGDYLLEFGQGLAIWSPYAFSKGSDAVTSTNKRSRGIIPYTSSDENQFLSGIASTILIDQLNITGFYSQNHKDANIDSVTNQILSTPLDGYHRTESEMFKNNRVTETLMGMTAQYSFGEFLKISGLFYYSKFNNSFSSSDVFDVEGSEFNFYSFAYNSFFNNITLSGEFAYNGISVASINKLQISFHRNFTFTALVRNYPRNYSNLHSNGFGEYGGTQNEFGIYAGIKWRTPIGLFNFYYDQFKFPYATYYNPIPSTGNEYLINYEIKPFSKTTLLVKYKREKKETATTVGNEIKLANRIKQNIRFEVKYRVSKSIQLRTRVELMYFDLESIENEKGFLIFQDVKYLPSAKLKIYGRIVFFQTDSYNSRVYEFENDLTGLMTNPALFGRGIKWYFLINYKPVKSISVSAKYSELYKPDERTLSTGLSEINGNIDNKFSVQIDIFL